MPVKQKPDPKLVKKIAKDLPKRKSAVVKSKKEANKTVKSMEGRVFVDEKNAPAPHKPAKKPSPKKPSKKSK